MSYVGIDPGLEGYSCHLPREGQPSFRPAPVMSDGKDYDAPGMYGLVLGWKALGVDLVVLEEQQAFPGIGPRCFSCGKPKRVQGVASSFQTGMGFGLWRMALEAAGVNYVVVGSQTWKHAFGVGGGDKKALKSKSVAKAQALFPEVDFRPLERVPKARVPDHNKAESALLAAYARRAHGTI